MSVAVKFRCALGQVALQASTDASTHAILSPIPPAGKGCRSGGGCRDQWSTRHNQKNKTAGGANAGQMPSQRSQAQCHCRTDAVTALPSSVLLPDRRRHSAPKLSATAGHTPSQRSQAHR
eukprot:362942-Chlamydomonas_euryale.AAC.8